jgi:AAA ATPase domain
VTATINDYPPRIGRKAMLPAWSADGGVVYGRDTERRAVGEVLRRARRGAGGVVLVEGEPGIGKSRLLSEAVSEAAGQGFSLAAGAADRLGWTIPFLASGAALRADLEQRAAVAPVLVSLLTDAFGAPPGPDLLATAAVLGSAFRLDDAADMLAQAPATLLPVVQEAMGAGMVTPADDAFAFRHALVRRAVAEMIPRPARQALHRQYAQILLDRGGPAAAQILPSSPQTAADLAARAPELTPRGDPGALPRLVAAAEALAAAGCRCLRSLRT